MKKFIVVIVGLFLSFSLSFSLSISYANINPYKSEFNNSTLEKLDKLVSIIKSSQSKFSSNSTYESFLDNFQLKLDGIKKKHSNNKVAINIANYLEFEVKQIKLNISDLDIDTNSILKELSEGLTLGSENLSGSSLECKNGGISQSLTQPLQITNKTLCPTGQSIGDFLSSNKGDTISYSWSCNGIRGGNCNATYNSKLATQSNTGSNCVFSKCLTDGYYVIDVLDTKFPNGCNSSNLDDKGNKCILKVGDYYVNARQDQKKLNHLNQVRKECTDKNKVCDSILMITDKESAPGYCNNGKWGGVSNWYLPDVNTLFYKVMNNKDKLSLSMTNGFRSSTYGDNTMWHHYRPVSPSYGAYASWNYGMDALCISKVSGETTGNDSQDPSSNFYLNISYSHDEININYNIPRTHEFLSCQFFVSESDSPLYINNGGTLSEIGVKSSKVLMPVSFAGRVFYEKSFMNYYLSLYCSQQGKRIQKVIESTLLKDLIGNSINSLSPVEIVQSKKGTYTYYIDGVLGGTRSNFLPQEAEIECKKIINTNQGKIIQCLFDNKTFYESKDLYAILIAGSNNVWYIPNDGSVTYPDIKIKSSGLNSCTWCGYPVSCNGTSNNIPSSISTSITQSSLVGSCEFKAKSSKGDFTLKGTSNCVKLNSSWTCTFNGLN